MYLLGRRLDLKWMKRLANQQHQEVPCDFLQKHRVQIREKNHFKSDMCEEKPLFKYVQG